ncbi:CA_C0660 family putative sactipeptide bacteriocin [Clostridium felsineum]|uniref:CA_C0660 family putative sactipeptide bacteriocin n=1 Tax=Clostridium felsineum TaxID=36839 RepID=UPI00098C73BF|nr:CA_C0660 family putative sactipeptide bacteriocin [Clostridium felsineum]URZ01767.1 hypothetical protein CLAUR_017630 [Clostridium felsineum]
MKLVNPVGRDVLELETEAYSCHCVCSSGSEDALMDGRDGGYNSCQCDWWYHANNKSEANSKGIM